MFLYLPVCSNSRIPGTGSGFKRLHFNYVTRQLHVTYQIRALYLTPLFRLPSR